MRKNRILGQCQFDIRDYQKKNITKKKKEKRVQEAISKLKDKHKLPLILYYYRSLSYKEIAEILGVPEGQLNLE